MDYNLNSQVTLHFIHMGKLWGVCLEYFRRNWPCCKRNALYDVFVLKLCVYWVCDASLLDEGCQMSKAIICIIIVVAVVWQPTSQHGRHYIYKYYFIASQLLVAYIL